MTCTALIGPKLMSSWSTFTSFGDKHLSSHERLLSFRVFPNLLDAPGKHLGLYGTCMGRATKLVLSGPSSERITKFGVTCDRPIRKFSTGPGV